MPKQQEYQLPIHVLTTLTPADEEIVLALDEFKPISKHKPGDLAVLSEVPPHLRFRHDAAYPRFWKIRFVISAWAYELYRILHEYPGSVRGYDHAVALVEGVHKRLPFSRYRSPMIYAHAYPHGLYPNSAAWLPERALRKVQLREPNAEWPIILEEAKAPLIGYDTDLIRTPFIFDLAPDDYSIGENIGRPFEHEESTFHTACLLGLEEKLVRPATFEQIGDPNQLDPEHDVF